MNMPQLGRLNVDVGIFHKHIPSGALVIAIDGQDGCFYFVEAEGTRARAPYVLVGVKDDFRPVGTWVLDTPYDEWKEPTPDQKREQVRATRVG